MIVMSADESICPASSVSVHITGYTCLCYLKQRLCDKLVRVVKAYIFISTKVSVVNTGGDEVIAFSVCLSLCAHQ